MSYIEELLQKIKKLEDENKKLRNTIQNLQESQGYEICKFFNKCNSIKKTQIEYYFDGIKDCYNALVDYYGCSDPVQDADDYKEYYKDIFGYEFEEDDYDYDYENEDNDNENNENDDNNNENDEN
jgi:hypothetical protein